MLSSIANIFSVPTIPSGNIHAPVVMVAEKGADLIKELWLQPNVVQAEAESNQYSGQFNDQFSNSFDSFDNITLV